MTYFLSDKYIIQYFPYLSIFEWFLNYYVFFFILDISAFTYNEFPRTWKSAYFIITKYNGANFLYRID